MLYPLLKLNDPTSNKKITQHDIKALSPFTYINHYTISCPRGGSRTVILGRPTSGGMNKISGLSALNCVFTPSRDLKWHFIINVNLI